MKRLLIVDDVPNWVNFHKTNIEYLEIPNLEIDTANSAKEALAKIEASIDNPYYAIFTDLQMESDFLPKLAGVWLIEQIATLKKYYEDTNVVIISASPSSKEIAKRHGVYAIPKHIVSYSRATVYKRYVE